MQGDNMFVDMSGLWWLGDFGSAVVEGTPIVTTTPWFAPSKNLEGEPAAFFYDWQVLELGLGSYWVGTKLILKSYSAWPLKKYRYTVSNHNNMLPVSGTC